MKYILMACLMALGPSAWAQEEAFTAKIFKSKGNVECLKKGASGWIPVEAPYMLGEGDQVKTGPKAMADIYIKYGSKIRLAADTAFTVSKVAPEGNTVEVMRGKLTAWIRHFTGRAFTVRTPSAVCAVRGTVFGVEVSKSGDATWDLFKGAVQISDNQNRTADLMAGQRLSVARDAGITAQPTAIPADVKVPGEPAKTKEEKQEIKAEEAVTEARKEEAVQKEEQQGEKKEEAAQAETKVQEPESGALSTQVVQESGEVSSSTP